MNEKKRRNRTAVQTIFPEEGNLPAVISPPPMSSASSTPPTHTAAQAHQPPQAQSVSFRPAAAPRSTQEQDQEDERRRRIALFLFAGALVLVAIASTFGGNSVSQKDLTSLGTEGRTVSDLVRGPRPLTFDERVLKHKDETGLRMNRERMRMQRDNLFAQPIADGAGPQGRTNALLNGLPLNAEKHPYARRKEPNAPSTLESRIQNDIQTERNLDEWEQKAREEYVREFISNARAMGYEVFVDQDYNVDYKPMDNRARRPQSAPGGDSVNDAAD